MLLIGFVCDVIGYNVERSFYHLSNFSFSQHSLNETDETSDTFLQNDPKSNFTHCQSWHALPSVRLTARGIALLIKNIVINHKKSDLFVMLNIILQSPSMHLHIHPYRCTNISFCSSTHYFLSKIIVTCKRIREAINWSMMCSHFCQNLLIYSKIHKNTVFTKWHEYTPYMTIFLFL